MSPRGRLVLLLGIVVGVAVVALVLAGSGSREPVPTASSAQATQGSVVPGSSIGNVADLWPAPADPLDRTVAAGLEPGVREFLINHVHAHLDVFVDGQPVTVPAGIGINIADPGVRRFDEPGGTAYGGIEGCARPCISPLHTHDTTGILHTESSTPDPNTLGEFFTEWGVALSQTCVGTFCRPQPIAVYIDGRPYTGDPTAIQLTDRLEIAIVIGTPPAEVPSTADFSAA